MSAHCTGGNSPLLQSTQCKVDYLHLVRLHRLGAAPIDVRNRHSQLNWEYTAASTFLLCALTVQCNYIRQASLIIIPASEGPSNLLFITKSAL